MSKPKFKVGDIVRTWDMDFGKHRTTNIMEVIEISKNHGREGLYKYYGKSFFGGVEGVYEFDLTMASKKDIKSYEKERAKYE